MAGLPQDVDKLSPDKLMLGFTRSKIMLGIGVAVAIHLVLLLATSVTYIRDRWIDPEGAARRKAEQLEARKAKEAEAAAASEKALATTKRPAAPSTKAPGAASPAAPGPDEARKNTPVVKGITELPKKGEIPKKPDDLGISIDDTNK